MPRFSAIGLAPAATLRRPAAGVVVLTAAILTWTLTSAGLPTSVPSCSWPLRVRGHATSEQAGLIRCYLRALARHDTAGLLAVAYATNGPVRFTAADFRHAADTRAGLATATFTPGDMDNAYAVTITYADHATQTIAMGLANPGSMHSWRLGIGTQTNSTGGPPPTKPSPP